MEGGRGFFPHKVVPESRQMATLRPSTAVAVSPFLVRPARPMDPQTASLIRGSRQEAPVTVTLRPGGLNQALPWLGELTRTASRRIIRLTRIVLTFLMLLAGAAPPFARPRQPQSAVEQLQMASNRDAGGHPCPGPRFKKAVLFSSGTLAAATLILTGFALRGPMLEAWYTWRLEDTSEKVAISAARALGALGRPGAPAIPALETIAAGDQPDLRYAAKTALKRIRGSGGGRRPSARRL
jgi:hypothetical protein